MDDFYQLAEDALKKVEYDFSALASMVDWNTVNGRKTIQFLLKHSFITVRGPLAATTIADITPTGSSAIDVGVYKYINDIEQSKREKSDLEIKKLRIDVRNAERIFKTYWWTFGFAIAGLLLAIYSTFFKHK